MCANKFFWCHVAALRVKFHCIYVCVVVCLSVLHAIHQIDMVAEERSQSSSSTRAISFTCAPSFLLAPTLPPSFAFPSALLVLLEPSPFLFLPFYHSRHSQSRVQVLLTQHPPPPPQESRPLPLPHASQPNRRLERQHPGTYQLAATSTVLEHPAQR